MEYQADNYKYKEKKQYSLEGKKKNKLKHAIVKRGQITLCCALIV